MKYMFKVQLGMEEIAINESVQGSQGKFPREALVDLTLKEE